MRIYSKAPGNEVQGSYHRTINGGCTFLWLDALRKTYPHGSHRVAQLWRGCGRKEYFSCNVRGCTRWLDTGIDIVQAATSSVWLKPPPDAGAVQERVRNTDSHITRRVFYARGYAICRVSIWFTTTDRLSSNLRALPDTGATSSPAAV
jgi:hypothetical protein